jgi:uncharacterized protein YuzE
MTYPKVASILKRKSPICVTIDKRSRVIYLKYSEHTVQRTERINPTLSVDYGKSNSMVGVEITRLNQIDNVLRNLLEGIFKVVPNLVSPTPARQDVQARARRSGNGALRRILASVPHRKPLPGDVLLDLAHDSR